MYLFCLVVGGALLLLGLLGHDLHLDVGHDDVGHGELGQGSELAEYLSLRALVALVAFFGLGGVVAPLIGLSGGEQLAFALACGVLVAVCAALLTRLARRQGNLSTQAAPLVGRVGQVLVPNRQGESGKLELTVAGQREQWLFRSPQPLEAGDQALIVSEADGLLEVSHWDGP